VPDNFRFKTNNLFLEEGDMVSTMNQEEKIRLRAFELFEKRGRKHGHELDDWLKAEKEVLGFKMNEKANKKKQII
jgi:hypothetical protein